MRRTRPAARRRCCSSSPMPSSASTSSVCSPSSGGWRRTCCGVPDSFTAKPMLGTLPSTGWSISMRIWRACACSLPKASGYVRIGPGRNAVGQQRLDPVVLGLLRGRCVSSSSCSAARLARRSEMVEKRGSCQQVLALHQRAQLHPQLLVVGAHHEVAVRRRPSPGTARSSCWTCPAARAACRCPSSRRCPRPRTPSPSRTARRRRTGPARCSSRRCRPPAWRRSRTARSRCRPPARRPSPAGRRDSR